MQECRYEPPDAAESQAAADGAAAGRLAVADAQAPAEAAYSYAGAGFALFAISIWAGWFISTRFNVTSNLGAYDLIALRFGVSALVLLPLAARLGFGIGKVSLMTAVALFAGSGVVYSLCATLGVAFAPAAEGAALTPGVMPLAAALLSVLILKEPVRRTQIVGFVCILAGVLFIAGLGLFDNRGSEWMGHALFITGAFLFAGYTVALRQSGLTGLEAAALVAIWSSLAFLPIYAFALHPRIFSVAPHELLVPAIYQGVLTNIVSLAAYGQAVARLGASRAAPFAALIPALTALLAIAILGEFPKLWDWIGIVAVSAGVYLASGAPLPLVSRR